MNIINYQPLHNNSEYYSKKMIVFLTVSESWCHLGIGIIHLVILSVLHLFLLMVVVKVVWFIGPPNLPPRKLNVGLMVVYM